jgi:hypothetical protein
VSGSTVYISGNFSTLGGLPRNFTGAVSAATGAVLAFNPNPDFVVLKSRLPPTPCEHGLPLRRLHRRQRHANGTAAAVDATTGAVKRGSRLQRRGIRLLPDATRVIVSGVFVDSALVHACRSPRSRTPAFPIRRLP